VILENKKTGVQIGVFTLNTLKKPFLGIKRDNKIVKYGSFDNEFKAVDFMEELADFCGAEVSVDDNTGR